MYIVDVSKMVRVTVRRPVVVYVFDIDECVSADVGTCSVNMKVVSDDVGACSVNVKVVYAVGVGLDDDDKVGITDGDAKLDVAGLEPRRLAMMDSAV